MARLQAHYSQFLTGWQNLVGISSSIGISTDIAAVANAMFNNAIQEMWDNGPWIEISPYGEARFLGNRLTYPNDLSQTANWTATAVTVTANNIANPADGNVTASKVLETSATSAHKLVQTVTNFFPSTSYTVSFYARPNGRNYQYLSVSDGVTTYTAFFNTSAGTVGTTANFTTTTIAQQPNGFWLCQATFTSNASATSSGSYTVQLSTDGATLSYAGDATKGCYVWGCLVQQTSNVPVQDSVLSWNQTGENAIDAIFNVWPVSPFVTNYPVQMGYNITPNGIQMVNGSPYQYSYYVAGVAQSNIYGAVPNNPIYIYYRQTCPQFTGTTYSASATYSVNQQIFFTNSAGDGDFYKCIVATSAGQSPDTTAASWSVITLWDTFLQYVIYKAFADWLVQDGQQDKAIAMYKVAEDKMNEQFDKNERQMNVMSPMIVTTHLSSRPAY